MINKILLLLEQSASFNKYIDSVHPSDLQQDLKSEVYLILSEKKPAVLEQLVNDNKVEQFAVAIAKTQIQSTNSAFYIKYRKPLPVQKQIDSYQEMDIATLRAVDDELVSALVNVGCNVKKLSNQTKIPYKALLDMTKEIAEKNRINKQGIATSITIKVELKVADHNRSITSIKSDVNKLLNSQLKGVKVKDVLLSNFI
jgi:hypothetical protein